LEAGSGNSSLETMWALAAAPEELAPGDFITYAGDAPHIFEALESGTRAVLVSEAR
jgi:quercetin dioxygenase-like cupin family protein